MEALREAIHQAMEKDERVFLIGEDIGVYGGAFGVSAGLLDKFGPERIIDTPISEAGIAGACVGAAVTGMRPIGEIQFSDFVVLAMEQIVMQGAKMRFMFGGKAQLPFVIRLAGGSGTGAAAQHSESLENWMQKGCCCLLLKKIILLCSLNINCFIRRRVMSLNKCTQSQ